MLGSAKTKGRIMQNKNSKNPRRCHVCGYRIRGKLHEEGRHHQAAAKEELRKS